ncbi:UNVERIFIED_CONTAM: hypothetical protein K2H54_063364 [Gekko kuhli]
MLEPLPIGTARNGSEMPNPSHLSMGPVADPEDRRLDLHPANISWSILLNPGLHHLTPMPGTITPQNIDRIRDRGPRFGTVILGTKTSPLRHLMRLEPRIAHLHPRLLGLLQSYTKLVLEWNPPQSLTKVCEDLVSSADSLNEEVSKLKEVMKKFKIAVGKVVNVIVLVQHGRS